VNARSDDNEVQSAAGILLVRPAHFGHNAQTAVTNRFQHRDGQVERITELARSEFDALVLQLKAAGIRVCVADDTSHPPKPDAVFPNNWVSFHRNGTVVLYPMLAPNRRAERRTDVLDAVGRQLGYTRRRLLDLSGAEATGRYLEGTGSLVLDHVHRIAYACRSARTDERLLQQWCTDLDYEPLSFDAHGTDGTPLYHTNVMMSIGSRCAIVCSQAIINADRGRVLQRLGSTRTVINISRAAMERFAANILELRAVGTVGVSRHLMVLSESARTALQREQSDAWDRLRASVDDVLVATVPTIERVGGGGVRCMLTEVPEVKT
jgi:hypothetical protein